jgi:hypothetical protein
MALDPLAFVHPLNLGTSLSTQGRHTEAVALIERSIELGAGRDGRFFLVGTLIGAGRVDDAEAVATQLCAEIGADSWQCGYVRAHVLFGRGRVAEALAAVDALAARNRPGQAPVANLSFLALLYSQDPQGMGRAAAAVRAALESPEWFTSAPLVNGARGARLPEEISTDPEWLAAWDDPRLAELMTLYRANLAKFRQGG